MQQVVIFGVGEFAELLYYYLENESNYEVVAFSVDKKFINSSKFYGLPIVAFEDIASYFPPNSYKMIMGLGYSNMRKRKVIFDKIKKKEYKLINYIHPSINTRDMSFGENNIIFPGCIIEPDAAIGDNNVLWSMTLLGHNTRIGSHNFVSGKCLFAGKVSIGDLCFVGTGVNTINSIRIEDETHIVAGSNVIQNTKECGRYFGNPARLIDFHKEAGIVISD